jgi:hypothetical protein
MGVEFGSFNSICQTAALVICPLVGSNQGIEPSCYSRNVDVAGTLIFQPCELLLARCLLTADQGWKTDWIICSSYGLCAHSSDNHDSDNDLAYPKQIYRCR